MKTAPDGFAKAKALINDRRAARGRGDNAEVVKISKRIQKEVRRATEQKKRAKIDQILSGFKGLRYIADIRNNGKRKQLSSIVDIRGGATDL